MLQVDFINVGYGDSILLRTKGDAAPFTMLVDCGDVTIGNIGPGSRRCSAVEYLRAQGVQRLDLLVLTHLHLDHVGGLPPLCEQLEIGEFWTNFLPERVFWDEKVPLDRVLSGGANNLIIALDRYLGSLRVLEEKGVRLRRIQTATEVMVPVAGLSLAVACADAALYARQEEILQDMLCSGHGSVALDELDDFINDISLRLSVGYGETRMLLPGDITAPCWSTLSPERCDILKIPHHGHTDSLTPELLERLGPKLAIACVSNDRPDDCPGRGVARMLEQQGVTTYCTDAVAFAGMPAHHHGSVRIEIGDDIRVTLP